MENLWYHYFSHSCTLSMNVLKVILYRFPARLTFCGVLKWWCTDITYSCPWNLWQSSADGDVCWNFGCFSGRSSCGTCVWLVWTTFVTTVSDLLFFNSKRENRTTDTVLCNCWFLNVSMSMDLWFYFMSWSSTLVVQFKTLSDKLCLDAGGGFVSCCRQFQLSCLLWEWKNVQKVQGGYSRSVYA